MTVRTRIAPSPTGDPHVGTGYIALFNYAFAKQHGGAFILRIEDTDQKRSTKESEQSIFDALDWLGITFDEGPHVGGTFGPYRQSERLEIYRAEVKKLFDAGHAYRCTCTTERLQEVREKQRVEKSTFGYDGHCRNRDVSREIESGVPFVIRLRTPDDGETSFHDELRGVISIPNREVDDQVLMKADGFPTYHLANVVDDHLMEITHVIRGEEWISSTPKHVMLYEAFGWTAPKFAHLPLLRNADKSKVSKRKNPVSLLYYKDAGFFPDALLNFLGHMAFTFEDERELFSLADFVTHFDLSRVSLGGPVFDMQKLKWMNGQYLREIRSDDELLAHLKNEVFSDAYLRAILPLVKPRIETSDEFVAHADFFFSGDVDLSALEVVPPGVDREGFVSFLEVLAESIDGDLHLSSTSLDARVRSAASEKGLKPKQVFMPLRLIVTGRAKSPDLLETMVVLGRERCRSRIRSAIRFLRKDESVKEES